MLKADEAEVEGGTRNRTTGPVLAVISGAVFAAFVLFAAPSYSLYEVSIFRVSAFGDPGECYGDDSTLNHYWTDLVSARADDTWDYDDIGFVQVNSAVDSEDFTDYTRFTSWGDDMDYSDGTDWADTVFITTHGYSKCMELVDPYDESTGDWLCCGHDGYNCGRDPADYPDFSCSSNNYSRFTMGDNSTGRCYVFTNDNGGDPGNIYLGNTITGQGTGDANVFFTTACDSLDPCVRHLGGYDDMDAGSFNTYLGFYGRHDFAQGGTVAFNAFLTGATNDAIGSEWLSHEYYLNGGGNDGYVCPMVLIWGSSSSNCDNMYNNGGFKDFKDTGSHTTTKMYWVGGCDPEDEGYDLYARDHPALPDM
jgi:hypothetical protein